jgi:hypothetical protein
LKDKCIRDRYYELWTDSRMEIPHERFVIKARRMGARFPFGTNGRTEKVVGALEFSRALARKCQLAAKDVFVPNAKK